MNTLISNMAPPPGVKNSAATILIVDDQPENLTVLGELLQPHYRVKVASSGARALKIALSEPRPDLILLDVMMPEMDGYTVLHRLRETESTQDIPVIFVTALGDAADEEHGLELGAVDYIAKPIKPAIVLARLHTQLELKQARDWLKDQNAFLESEVSRRMRENQLIQDISLHALAGLAEARDNETGNHIRRTQAYVEVLGRKLQSHPQFVADLIEPRLVLIVKAAPLHDIGKVGIPDHILLKPGKLTAEEFEIMKTHSRIGGEAIEKAVRVVLDEENYRYRPLDMNSTGESARNPFTGPLAFLTVAKEIALWHHEKWDGSGYPNNLAADKIPISARLMALADVFDALYSRRVYKPPMPLEQATAIIVEGKGRHFDPDVVEAFLATWDQFKEIAHRYGDEDA